MEKSDISVWSVSISLPKDSRIVIFFLKIDVDNFVENYIDTLKMVLSIKPQYFKTVQSISVFI